MLLQAIELLLQVRHRIDDLEKSQKFQKESDLVRHRIDDLEKAYLLRHSCSPVRHRIDDLEK